ncbi:MAG: chromosome partitioning protein ParB [Planctomycetota bacterium]|nr:MAG: chromosome partitioning protein ParB [Planctomycetota bacterium]
MTDIDVPDSKARGRRTNRRAFRKPSATSKSDHVPIHDVPIRNLKPSPENDKLYRPVDPEDDEIRALAESIKQNGLLEPLIATADGYLVSGHRRFAAAKLAGLSMVPCRRIKIRRDDDNDGYLRLLREHNRQRDKTRTEKLREELVEVSETAAYEALQCYRRTQAAVDLEPMALQGQTRRAKISQAKMPMLEAVRAILKERREFWPLSDRQIHYALLNDPPLRHASKPNSRYDNTQRSYKSLVDLLTRARLAFYIRWNAIADETRPVSLWQVHDDPRSFVRQELADLLKGYWRNLQQSQPNHIEIVGEKNTVASILQPVAAEYCIPLTTGRGYCSLPPRYAMADRFEKSGKEKLVLLIVSDFDPDGDEIAHSFARSMRDDFQIEAIQPVKVALTAEQVVAYQLPPNMQAKQSSVHHAKFVERHGSDDVFELEALAPEQLQQILREAIEAVLDREAFDAEVAAERKDAAHLEAVRRTVCQVLSETEFFEEEE